MTLKEEKYILEAILEKGIDRNSSNCYNELVNWMNELPVECKDMRVSMTALKSVLEKLSKKWDKEIDKVL